MPKQVLEALVKSFSAQFLNHLLPEEEDMLSQWGRLYV